MIEHSADITELAKALHGAQAMVEGVRKDSKNPHFKNNYASLEAVIDTARPALQANGIAFTQAPGALVDGAIEVTTMLVHASGQWMRSTLHVPLTKKDAQGVGSAITYGCRYSLMATLGLPPVDDDGEAARSSEPARIVDRAPQRTAASPSKLAEQIAGEVGICRSPGDIESLKRTPEFKRFWEISSEDDKSFVTRAVGDWKARHHRTEAA